MTAKDAIKENMDISDMFIQKYIGDLTDEEMLFQPYPDFNPIALQLGHVIGTEVWILEELKPGAAAALPEGFAAKHSLKEGDRADASRYHTKAEYLALMETVRAASKAALDAMSDEELDEPGPNPQLMRTKASGFNLMGSHAAGHAGQFVAIRRALKKPIVF